MEDLDEKGNQRGMGRVNFADTMKKGGKAKKKSKKQPTISQKQSVNVNVKIGDSVLLRKGNVPKRTSNPGVAKRLISQGRIFGGNVPAPLSGIMYASAPQVATPLSVMNTRGNADALYSLNRNKRDDISVDVNPSGIKADITPSVRAVENTLTPDPNMDRARALQKMYDGMDAWRKRLESGSGMFQPEIPRINTIDTTPSSRITPSEPSSGFLSTKGNIIGSSSSSGKEESVFNDTPYQPLDAPGLQSEAAVEKPLQPATKRMGVSQSKLYPPGSEERKKQTRRFAHDLAREEYPTKEALKQGGYKTYKEAEEDIYDHYITNEDTSMKRGGMVSGVF